MSDLTEALGRQMGPLPLGGWILAGAGGIAVAVVIRRRGLSSELSDAQAEAGSAVDGLNINGEGGDTTTNTGAGNLYQPDLYGDGTDDTLEKPTTNAEWRAQAVTVLAQNGYEGGRANRVLTRYISGYKIALADQDVITAAIRYVGAPPLTIKSVPEPAGLNNAASGRKQYGSNADWQHAAIIYLRTKTKYSDAKARASIVKALKGGILSQGEAAAYAQAVAYLGPPPKTPKPFTIKTVKAKSNSKTSSRRDVGVA